MDETRQTEIRDFDRGRRDIFRRVEQVLRLDVAMDDVERMTVGNGVDDRLNRLFRLRFRVAFLLQNIVEKLERNIK